MPAADETRRNLFRFALAAGTAGALLTPGEASANEIDAALFDLFVTKDSQQPADRTALLHWTTEPKSAEDGRAKFALVSSNETFEGVKDPIMFLGYNAEAIVGGGRSEEPVLAVGFEGLYRAKDWAQTGIQQDTMEFYLEYRNADRSITNFRPYATTLGRDDNEARWATTHVDIGTDPSSSKSQFFITGNGTLFKVTDKVIAFSRRLQIDGHSAYFNSQPGGKNSHVLFLQTGKLRWYLGNFHGDLGHFLWDATNDRRHVEYIAGATNAAAITRMHSRVDVLGAASFDSKAGFAEDVTVGGTLAVEGDVTVAGAADLQGDAEVAGNVVLGGAVTAAGDVALAGGLVVALDIEVEGGLAVAANVVIAGAAEVTGKLTVTADTALDGALTVATDLSIGGDLTVTDGGADVAGALAVGGALNVTANAEFSGDTKMQGKVGFNGTQPIQKRGPDADATDLASAIALINKLKADLVAYGLKDADPAP